MLRFVAVTLAGLAAVGLVVAVAAGVAMAIRSGSATGPTDGPTGEITYRPADLPLAPLPEHGPLRIVAFGTSLTLRSSWPDALSDRLADCLQREIVLVRIARSGAGTRWAETQLDAVMAARPDLVLIEFAINDADIRDGRSIAASRAAHLRLLDALATQQPRAQVLLMTTNPVAGPLRHLQRPRLAEHYAMVREVAAARDVGLADMTPRWRAARSATSVRLLADGLHPTDAAAKRIIVPALFDMIVEAGGARCTQA